MAQSKKELAAKNITRIKEQIKILKMMGGDPKVIARQIAQLAGELASAVREYSSGAGGGVSTTDVASSGLLTTGANDPVMAATNASDSAVTGDTVAMSDNGSKTSNVAEDAAASALPTATLTESTVQRNDISKQKLKADILQIVGKTDQQFSEAKANQEFINEVRSLTVQIKSLAEQQKHRLHKTGNQSSNQDFTKINQSLEDIERSLRHISKISITADISISTIV